jgi:hypothetical protein
MDVSTNAFYPVVHYADAADHALEKRGSVAYTLGTDARKDEDGLLLEFPCVISEQQHLVQTTVLLL